MSKYPPAYYRDTPPSASAWKRLDAALHRRYSLVCDSEGIWTVRVRERAA